MTTPAPGFSWDLLGDLQEGRPTLGPFMRVEPYRLLQYTLRAVLEKEHGAARTEAFFYEAGYLAGRHYYEQLIGPACDLQDFIKRLGQSLLDQRVGLLQLESADPQGGRFVLTIAEDLDCSGLPQLERTSCSFDEGFIAALLESFDGCRYVVREVDCWTNGARICRFVAEAARE